MWGGLLPFVWPRCSWPRVIRGLKDASVTAASNCIQVYHATPNREKSEEPRRGAGCSVIYWDPRKSWESAYSTEATCVSDHNKLTSSTMIALMTIFFQSERGTLLLFSSCHFYFVEMKNRCRPYQTVTTRSHGTNLRFAVHTPSKWNKNRTEEQYQPVPLPFRIINWREKPTRPTRSC